MNDMAIDPSMDDTDEVVDDNKLSDDELMSLVRLEIDNAISYQQNAISQDRISAMKYYMAEPYGDEQEERSKVVTTEVRDTIESILPQLIKIFLSTDRVVKFEPVGPEDEEAADQATDYINYILLRDNGGFMLLYTFFKDALLQKNGVVKCYWDETKTVNEETYRGLLESELTALLNDPNVEPTALTENQEMLSPGIDAMGMPMPAQSVTLYDVTIKRTNKKGLARVAPVPPEEFLISTKTANIKDARFCAHRMPKTVSALIDMGFDRDKVMDLASGSNDDGAERQQRFASDGQQIPDTEAVQDALREVWLTESYYLVDTDGDGIAEPWKIHTAGASHTLLKKERWEGAWPFESVTPVPMPHKFFGLSIHDLVADVQRIKSVLTRQFLDNIYQLNNNRMAVMEDRVNLDDLLTNRPGGIVRTKDSPAAVMMPIQPQPLGSIVIPALEYMDSIHENRTGVTKYNQGLDSNSLNKTFGGISAIMSAAQERLLLIARIFAETGVSGIFRQLLHLVCKHQDKSRVIQLRGKWVEMNPNSWNSDMDVTVDVALGTQNQQMMTAMLNQILGIQKEALAAGLPIVTLDNIYNTLGKMVENAGLKNVNSFFTDPSAKNQGPQQPQQDQGPSPAMIKAQADLAKTKLDNESDERIAMMKIEAEERMNRENAYAKLVTDGPGRPRLPGLVPEANKKPVRLKVNRNPMTNDIDSIEPIYEDPQIQEELNQPIADTGIPPNFQQ